MTDRERLVRRLHDWGTVEAEALADYLLENGVIVPPCKVGDTIYQIYEKCVCTLGHRELHSTCDSPIDCRKCRAVKIERQIRETDFSLIMLKRVGVEFFTTREEAEKILKDKQDKCMIKQYVENCEDCGFCQK